jgi:DNA-binding XRE family transcriptional regulator
MDRRRFSEIRRNLDKSQSQLAKLLCISTKTVQSFEHGLRKIPPNIERQMLLLSSLKKASRDNAMAACWDIANCPTEWRESCIVWELQARHYCWFLSGTFCQGKHQGNWSKKIEICRQCKVFQLAVQSDQPEPEYGTPELS